MWGPQSPILKVVWVPFLSSLPRQQCLLSLVTVTGVVLTCISLLTLRPESLPVLWPLVQLLPQNVCPNWF